ncbi:MAG: protein kinase, partial [Acidobacteriaceae bacterium]|nr:protein kinase [Acidobacteriaceae bacterium]
MVGSTVAHFEIVEHLGRGGMGDVYRARDLLLDRDVALKFLAPTFQADSHRLERFKQEAKSVSSLDHPNICTIYEIGTGTNGVPFIAMAYYAGETLRSRIDRGPLTTDESVALAIQMLRGLGQAHKRGIVHRDVKPSNLILTGDGLLKILDFGIAKLRRDQTVTATQGFTGTIPYMSPEQLAGKIDERSDLWSTGVVLYEMLTGRLPFEGDSAGEVVQRILNEEPQDIQIFRTGIPEDFRRVLSRALEKSPKDRYQTAEAMIGELRPAGSFDGRNPTVHERPATERRVLGAAAGGPSVAVLPFTTFGRSEEAEYFSDGVTEDIIHALSRLRGIRVVSRTSAFEFKGKAQDVRQIATRLGVNNVLEGSVRLSNNKLRVTVLLTNARDGCSLWSQRFDRDLADVFSIQEEIATSIATRLCTTLTVESAGRLSLR